MNDAHMFLNRRWACRIGVQQSRIAVGRGTKDIFRRDPCSFCGSSRGGTLDHILPRKIVTGHDRGDYYNFTGACQDCNCRKGGGHFLGFFAMVQGKPIIGYDHDPRGQVN